MRIIIGEKIKKIAKIIIVTHKIQKYTTVLSASLRKQALYRLVVPTIRGGVSAKP